ncbi:hypothetical protein ACKKBG_A07840 [Auxenochlorella protothecoides x Auxenochlorella symbiontica]
MPPLE